MNHPAEGGGDDKIGYYHLAAAHPLHHGVTDNLLTS
jgi:hypothetical protein